jgi:VCBS repeat-containing protein
MDTSDLITATGSGGTGGYSYSWTGPCDSPTSNATTFTAGIVCGDNSTDTITVTVTDSSMATANHNLTIHYIDNYVGICV